VDTKFNPGEKYGTIDGGGSQLYVRFGEGDDDVAPMSRMDFLSCRWLDEDRFSGIKQFAAEYAHLAVPQTERSLAQIYSSTQLMDLYDRLDARGVSLFYLPEKQFTKACWLIDADYAAEDKKDDAADTLIWLKWLKDEHTENLQPAIRDVEAHRVRGDDYRQLVKIVNTTLNTMRVGKYNPYAMYTESEFFPDGVDHAVKFMRDWCDKLDKDTIPAKSEKVKCVRELLLTIGYSDGSIAVNERTRTGVSAVDAGVYRLLIESPLYPMATAVAALIDPRTGDVHRKRSGKHRSVDEIMRVLGNSPNHGKMGVARSNIYWHLSRNRTIRQCKDIEDGPIKKPSGRPFGQDLLTEEQAGIHKQSMRDARKATRLCVRYVQRCLQGGRVSDRLF
jgi:hypothetical protein